MDKQIIENSFRPEPDAILDVKDESERQTDAEHALASIDAATLDFMIPNEFPMTETKLDPDFGKFVGVTEEAAGTLKENCRDRADTREAALKMTI
jgi:hypothetical protein